MGFAHNSIFSLRRLAQAAVFLATAAALLHACLSYSSWTRERDRFIKFSQSNGPQVCQQFSQKCAAEAERAHPGQRQSDDAVLAAMCRRHLEQGLTNDCSGLSAAMCRQNLELERMIDCSIIDPGAYSDYFIDTAHGSKLPSLTTAAWAAIAALMAIARLYISEPHIGWRRVALVASPVLAIGAGVLSAIATEEAEDALLIGTIGMPLAFVGVLGARRVYTWIREGFETHK